MDFRKKFRVEPGAKSSSTTSTPAFTASTSRKRPGRDDPSVSGVLALMAGVSALGLATTAVFARQVRKIPEGLDLEDEAGPG